MDVSKVDTGRAVMRPKRLWRAGVVSRPDMALQPSTCQLMGFWLRHDCQAYRELAVYDFKAMGFLGTHVENIYGTF